MRYYCISEDSNWADEIELSGMLLNSFSEELTEEKLLSYLGDVVYPLYIGIGTNQDLELNSDKEILYSLDVKELTKEQYETTWKALGGGHIGVTPILDYIFDNNKSFSEYRDIPGGTRDFPSVMKTLELMSENNIKLDNPMGERHNEDKLKWSLVPQSALEPMVRVLMYGAEKYDSYNWTKGLPITEICESLKRHLDAFMEGENLDLESGLPHIGHIQCNALFLSFMMEHRKGLDDRFIYKEEG